MGGSKYLGPLSELIPGSTGGIWSIIFGAMFMLTALGSYWGFNDLSEDKAWQLALVGMTLVLGHQVRRAKESSTGNSQKLDNELTQINE